MNAKFDLIRAMPLIDAETAEYHYGSMEDGVAYVQANLRTGKWTANQDENGYWWLHTNSRWEREEGSVYAESQEDAIRTHVIDRARMVGHDWAF